MRRVDWTDAAVADLDRISAYLCKFDRSIADSTISQLVLATDWLAEHPSADAPLEVAGLRKWRPRGSRYILIYKPAELRISVVRVRHERESWR